MNHTIAPPLPDVSERMRPFWEAARSGRLVVQACRRCDCNYFPAVESCNTCLLADRLDWRPASGIGEIFSFVVMHQVYHPAFADAVPYAVVDVRLAEGPRMISKLVDRDPASARVGARVEVAFVPLDDEIHLPVFRLS